MKRIDWKIAAARAATGSPETRLHSVTRCWAAARHEYLSLIEARPADVAALRSAAQRLENLERARRAAAEQLSGAA
jgi:hypothetical protein